MRAILPTVAIALLTVGVLRPEVAGRAAHLLVAVALLAVIVSELAPRLITVTPRTARPLVPPDPPPAPTVETPDVTELIRAIEQTKGNLPPLVARRLREIGQGRLADHHRLSLDRDADVATVRSMVTPPLWAILAGADDETSAIPVRSLSALLDELETL